ncbi:MAG: hypothetical protein EWM45_14960 [Rhodopseudomonas palustris]|nr:MAG: hypothetical protein EWM45_14960 [Rhodopseudomonas palustris]
MASSARTAAPHRKPARGQRWPLIASVVIACAAIAIIYHLLRPTWHVETVDGPGETPLSIGGTLFNVPTAAFRIKVQKHAGPQERVDLNFDYPSLQPPDKPKHVTTETADQTRLPERIFLSIAAHNDALSPEQRLRTIYPRYFAPGQPATDADGLSRQTFRAGTPYADEDLFIGTDPDLAARCTRDGMTPGSCLSERRVGGADLTFRFPRQWLTQWREVATAIDRLTSRVSSVHRQH